MAHVAVQSYKVASTLSSQRFVALSAADTAAYPASDQEMAVGITLDTVKDTTSSIPVAGPGSIAKVYFNDTVSAAGLVKSDSSGRAVPFTLSNTTTSLTLTSAYAGYLVGAAVAATATVANVFFCPGFVRTSA